MAKRFLVAVSGGVDSVVLLDMLATGQLKLTNGRVAQPDQLAVAHFDHGIRVDSASDQRFVAELAKRHQLEFVFRREELGLSASEALARQRRYQFLNQVAQERQAKIVTAHHRDDLLGTVAINILRGTGWRGLAPFSATNVWRPLLDRTKNELYNYALKNNLEYVEDSTNQGDQYLRNRLRGQLTALLPEAKDQLEELFGEQRQLRQGIEAGVEELFRQLDRRPGRSFFKHAPDEVALEVLRLYITDLSGVALTWLAIRRALDQVRQARSGSEHQLGQGVSIWLKKEDIIVGHTRPVV